jgi:2-C-methyl-D-erythritol 4-phosphate cytidylyltransferase
MNSAIILAAGHGKRMGSGADKLFLEVAGRSVIAHTWDRFNRADCIDEILLVIRDGLQERFEGMAARYGFSKPFRFTRGGAERQDSVWSGLEAISSGTQIVAIHDGARPCVPSSAIERVVLAARSTGAAVAARRVTDTIKESDGADMIRRTVDRSHLWAVQTPQAFRLDVIRRAMSVVQEKGLHVTDDTAACELIGQPVRLVEVPEANPKVTVPGDLALVELILVSGC